MTSRNHMGSAEMTKSWVSMICLSAVVATASSCSAGSGGSTAGTRAAAPAACSDYATQLRACLGADPDRLEMMLATLAVPPADEAAALQQQETCAREASRLRVSCR